MRNHGKIIFWNKLFGFIKPDYSENSIFFHKTNLCKNYRSVKLLDKVEFEISTVPIGKHKGEPLALNVEFIANGDFREYQRTIGRLSSWNLKYGFLISPQIDKEVFLYHTRLIKSNSSIKNGDYFTFVPIKSSKNPNQLFAFFAYPVNVEEDLDFLKRQKSENDIPNIENIISILIRSNKEMPIEKRFRLELEEITEGSVQNYYNRLVNLIDYYKKHFSFTPYFEDLSSKIPTVYQIQLWENNKIIGYDLEILINYFQRSSSDTKRIIINKLEKSDKIKVLRTHLDTLLKSNKLNTVNNDLKTFLDIIYRNKQTREIEIYNEVKYILIKNLKPKSCLSLYSNNYIDSLPESYVLKHFNINDFPESKYDNKKFERLFFKVHENYLLNFAKNKIFDEDYPELIQYLRSLNGHFSDKFNSIAQASIAHLSIEQKLIVWLFEPSTPFDGLKYVITKWKNLNIYFLVKLITNKKIKLPQELSNEIARGISEQTLLEFANLNRWNSLIIPVLAPNKESFITDISTFIENFNKLDIRLTKIADAIYDNLPLFTIHHLRLWLWGYVEYKRYDYVGYREQFNGLTTEEQKEFRTKGDILIQEEIELGEKLEVIPCNNIIHKHHDSTTYKAYVENIYFGNGQIRLRTENRTYTDVFNLEFASTGLNRIPTTSHYNQFEFIIKVEATKIINVDGFDEFFGEIHTGQIRNALGKNTSQITSKDERNISYVEDWKLRKKVIDYLNKTQYEGEPKIVNEPKTRYRRLEKGVDIDDFEKTHLYSLKTIDGFAIIWENIDLSENRATFIFKSLSANHQLQLSKIIDSIISYGQLRSTLISSKEDEILTVFKNDLGYVAKIHKQRGKKDAFENWVDKLEKSISLPIPDLPTHEQRKNLENWQDATPSAIRVKKTVKKIDERSIMIEDIDFDNTLSIQPKTSSSILTQNTKTLILQRLKEINQIIQNKQDARKQY